MARRAFAIVAHPDDIEFMMAGTLALLGEAGYELHYMTVANGSCGSVNQDARTIAEQRRQESLDAAAVIGAVYHESLCDDMEIYYERHLLQRIASRMRKVEPEIILTHPPVDYMEDHMNTCRLVLSAAFVRGMPNYPVQPGRAPTEQPVAIYHALPYGLRDPLRRRVQPDFYVDITSKLDTKRTMLAKHRSQKEFLDATQGIDSYLQHMEELSREMGQMSGRYTYAEGWTRHLALGYGPPNFDPLIAALSHQTMEVIIGP
ncbi:MAG: PIG-L family deacetylase [Caldilineaceae bacterium]|nr:PIG-L family deacetylase [Caldilineaceae bacterium]